MLETNVQNRKLYEFLAAITLAVYVFSQLIIRHTTMQDSLVWAGGGLENVAISLTTACVLITIFLKRYERTIAQIIATVLSIVVLTYSLQRTDSYLLVISCFVLFAVSDVDYRKLMKIYLQVMVPCIAAIMLLSIAGLVVNKDVAPGGRLVFSYGFTHPNTLGALLVSVFGAFACINREKKRGLPLAVALSWISGGYAMMVLNSHASAVVLFCYGLIALVERLLVFRFRVAFNPKRMSFLVVACLVVSIAFVLALVAVYTSESAAMTVVNKLFHSRISHAHRYFVEHGGYTLFGRGFVRASSYHDGGAFSAIDCGYANLALVYGLASLCILSIAVVRAVAYGMRGITTCFEWAAILLMLAQVLFEVYPLYLSSNALLLLLFCNKEARANDVDLKRVPCDPRFGFIALLLVAMVFSGGYGIRNSATSASLLPGEVTIERDENTFSVTVAENLDASIRYGDVLLHGHLVLCGGDEESLLYQVKKPEYDDATKDSSTLTAILRVPRSGFVGDCLGPWMVYIADASIGLDIGDWAYVASDNTAMAGSCAFFNPMTATRSTLMSMSSQYKWLLNDDGLLLYTHG